MLIGSIFLFFFAAVFSILMIVGLENMPKTFVTPIWGLRITMPKEMDINPSALDQATTIFIEVAAKHYGEDVLQKFHGAKVRITAEPIQTPNGLASGVSKITGHGIVIQWLGSFSESAWAHEWCHKCHEWKHGYGETDAKHLSEISKEIETEVNSRLRVAEALGM